MDEIYTLDDLRSLIGFGLGTTKLDNELIRDAFISGGGAAAGMAIKFLDLDDETGDRFAAFVLHHLTQFIQSVD